MLKRSHSYTETHKLLKSLYSCPERHKMSDFLNKWTERRGPNLGLHVHPTPSEVFWEEMAGWSIGTTSARVYSEPTSPQQLTTKLQKNVNSCATRPLHVGQHTSQHCTQRKRMRNCKSECVVALSRHITSISTPQTPSIFLRNSIRHKIKVK
jgi:hypothetical protein